MTDKAPEDVTRFLMFRSVLRAAKWFAADDEVRPALNYVRIMSLNATKLRVTATNGFILFDCECDTDIQGTMLNKDGIFIPAKSIPSAFKSKKGAEIRDWVAVRDDGSIVVDCRSESPIKLGDLDRYPDVDTVLKPAIRNAKRTMEYGEKIRNVDPEMRVYEVGFSVGQLYKVASGLRDFQSEGDRHTGGSLFRDTKRDRPTLIESWNSASTKANILLMPFHYHANLRKGDIVPESYPSYEEEVRLNPVSNLGNQIETTTQEAANDTSD